MPKDFLKKSSEEDRNFFEKTLEEAARDGRLLGKFICPVCGMKHWTEREADMCCREEKEE